MEAQGPIPDLLRKVLTAYETVSSGTGRLHGADGTSSTSSTSSTILPRPQLCAWGGPGMGSPQSHWIHRRAGGGPAGRCPEGPHRLWTPQTWDPTNLGPRRPHLARRASCGAAHGGRNPIKSRSPEPLPSFVLQGDLAARQALAAPHLAAPCQGDPQPTPSHPLFSPHLLHRQGAWGGMWGAGGVLSTSRCPSCPQMIQTSRTLIESADAVHSKLIQAQQAGGCWGVTPELEHVPRVPGMRGGTPPSPLGMGVPAGIGAIQHQAPDPCTGSAKHAAVRGGGQGVHVGVPRVGACCRWRSAPGCCGGRFPSGGGQFCDFPMSWMRCKERGQGALPGGALLGMGGCRGCAGRAGRERAGSGGG